MDATTQGLQFCPKCGEETWHTPKLGLIRANLRKCDKCGACNEINLCGITKHGHRVYCKDSTLTEIAGDVVKAYEEAKIRAKGGTYSKLAKAIERLGKKLNN